ncbi:hypothetical protein ACFWNE_33375 [Streptomyces goshikiensis]|uniref:hypothetical protein n=1 Tax=Streptomyces goshikiensis TaxID=1942 RepID=UPI0036660FFB
MSDDRSRKADGVVAANAQVPFHRGGQEASITSDQQGASKASEAAPTAKGPAPAQLPTETTDARMALEGNDENEMGTTAVRSTSPETTEPVLIPADQVKPEDIGTLSLHHVDGVPVLVVSGGKAIPAGLTVVDGSGQPVATYAASPTIQSRTGKAIEDVVLILTGLTLP